MTNYIFSALTIIALTSQYAVSAESVSAETVSTPSATTSMLQVIIGLIIVLAVLAGLAWLLKQFNVQHGNQNAAAKIVGGVSVGSRERVIIVEVADRWLVLGVSPGQITSIANLEKSAQLPSNAQQSSTQTLNNPFNEWLAKALKK